MKRLLPVLGVLFAILILVPLMAASRTGSTGNVDLTWDTTTGGLLVDRGVVSAAYAINVPATSCIVTDGNVGAVVFPANLIAVTIIPRSTVATAGYLRFGAAASASAGFQIPPGGYLRLPLTATAAATLRIIGDANFIADVLIVTPR